MPPSLSLHKNNAPPVYRAKYISKNWNKLGTSMISKSQEETEVSLRLEDRDLEAGVERMSWRTPCDLISRQDKLWNKHALSILLDFIPQPEHTILQGTVH